MSRVLVTGAGGFVGRALCPALAAGGFDIVRGDRGMGTIDAGWRWPDGLGGIDAVVHLAAPPPDAPAARHDAEIAAGAPRLAEEAARTGVRRLIHLSTVKVHGETSPPGAAFTELEAPAPETVYAYAKLRAEEALGEVARRTGLELVILRPPAIYGPGVGGALGAFLRLCDSPWPLPFGALRANRRSLLFVGNLVDAIALLLRHEDAHGRTFLLRDDVDLSTALVVERLRTACGRTPRLIGVPPGVLRAALGALGHEAHARRLADSLCVDDTHIRRTMGWRPPVTLDAALAATVAGGASSAGVPRLERGEARW